MKYFNIRYILFFSTMLLLGIQADVGSSKKMTGYDAQRSKMVKYQIKNRGIHDSRVLTAMETVPRHAFVPENLRQYAYEDRPLPIGHGQTISQPYIVALMTELLKADSSTRALEVGTGSGYQAAVLARIAAEVYSVEIVEPLHQRSKQTLNKLGYTNVFTTHADGYYGWKEHGPFDAIVVTCASEFIPPPLIEQLKQGGRMVIPVGPPFKVQHLILIEKRQGDMIRTTVIASVRFVPLIRDEKSPG